MLLGPAAARESYLVAEKIVEACRRTGAQAVHPGYGFLSENADFADALAANGIAVIGPPASAIRAMGSKSEAKKLMGKAAVPLTPGYHGDDQTPALLHKEADAIGYPVLIKAAAGGGGKGMRLVEKSEDFPDTLASCKREAISSFGNDHVLIEKYITKPRHIEIQVFADSLGNCVYLFERDCSVQRRHQKIIEESPSPAVDAALRERMGACAVAMAQAAGYVGAGTVEFLLDGAEFFLMEMNTRLQVEHPVTEALTGLDLVEWQIRVARGGPLPLTQDQVHLQGHAIEVRLCAEDAHFRPHTGRVLHFSAPPATAFERAVPGVLRFDHALEEGAEVTPHYDTMLGKLIATRRPAAGPSPNSRMALDDTVLLGLPSNRAFLAACLRHPVFGAGEATIPFLAQHGDGLRAALQPPHEAGVAAALAATWLGRAGTSLSSPFVRRRCA